MKHLKNCILLLCVCMTACEFAPHGSHFEKVNPNPSVWGSIDLNLVADTVLVQGTINLLYDVQLPGRSISGTQLYLDHNLLHESNRTQETYALSSTQYNDGYHTLTVLAVANSGTGSLGDKMGVEEIFVYRSWVVFIQNHNPRPVSITSLSERDGRLRITWEKYKFSNFKEYNLLKTSQETSVRITIKDINITEWIDSSYVGGNANYFVGVTDRANRLSFYDSQKSITINDALPTLAEYRFNPDSTFLVKITPPKYYNNVEGYEIAAVSYTSNYHYATTDPAQHAFTLPFEGFGTADYSLKTVSKRGALFTGSIGSGFKLQSGFAFHPYTSLHYSPSNNAYYCILNNKVVRIDGNTMQVTAENLLFTNYSTTGQKILTVSANGKFVYAANATSLWQLDPESLQEILPKSADRAHPTPTSFSYSAIMVSNNNRLAYEMSYYGDARYYVYDFINAKLLFSNDFISSENFASISPDGNFFYTGGQFYSIREDGVQAVRHSVWPTLFMYHPTEPQYLLLEDGKIKIYSTEDAALIKEIDALPGMGFVGWIDPSTGYFGRMEKGYFIVYDQASMQQIARVKISSSKPVQFLNRNLFSDGYYLPIHD